MTSATGISPQGTAARAERRARHLIGCALALVLVACGGGGSDDSTDDSGPKPDTIDNAPYFPLAVGNEWAYCVPATGGTDGCNPDVDDCSGYTVAHRKITEAVTKDGRVGRTMLLTWSNIDYSANFTFWASQDVVASFVSHYPYQGVPERWETEFKLPPRTNDEYTTYEVRDLDAAEDPDNDGHNESIDATQKVKVAGPATVDVPAGRFSVVKIVSDFDETYTYSRTPNLPERNTEHSEIAYHEQLGMVRLYSQSSYGGEGSSSGQMLLIAYSVGSQKSALNPQDVTPQDCKAALDPAKSAAPRAAASTAAALPPGLSHRQASARTARAGMPDVVQR